MLAQGRLLCPCLCCREQSPYCTSSRRWIREVAFRPIRRELSHSQVEAGSQGNIQCLRFVSYSVLQTILDRCLKNRHLGLGYPEDVVPWSKSGSILSWFQNCQWQKSSGQNLFCFWFCSGWNRHMFSPSRFPQFHLELWGDRCHRWHERIVHRSLQK